MVEKPRATPPSVPPHTSPGPREYGIAWAPDSNLSLHVRRVRARHYESRAPGCHLSLSLLLGVTLSKSPCKASRPMLPLRKKRPGHLSLQLQEPGSEKSRLWAWWHFRWMWSCFILGYPGIKRTQDVVT